MALDQDLQDKLIKLGVVSETLASAWGKSAKTIEAQEAKLAAKIQAKTKVTEDEAKAQAKALLNAERGAARQEDLDKKREEAAKQLASDFIGLTKSAASSAQAIYTSDKAFTSVTPTLELLSQATKAVAGAMTGLLSGVPIISGLSEGANKLIGAGIDITTQVASMMLTNAQTFVDTYSNLSKVGANFGGNMDDMMNAAHEGGLSLSEYQKFVSASADALRTLGGTTEQAAGRILKMSQSALKNNDRLLIEYGGYDQVADTLANFTANLTKAGVNTVAIQDQLNEVSENYLISLKEIESITGRTVKQQQDAEAEALTNIAFQRKYEKVRAEQGIQAANAMMAEMHNAYSLGGKSAENYYKELAATGTILSTQNLEYRAYMPAYAKTVEGLNQNRIMYGKLNDAGEARMQADARVVDSSKGALRANRDANDSVYNLAFAIKNGAVATIGKFGSDAQNTIDKVENFGEATRQATEQAKKNMGDSSKGSADARRAQIKTQKEMDDITRKNMGNMADLVVTLNDLQVKLIETFGPKLTTAVDMFASGIKKIAEQLGIQAPTSLSDAIKASIEGDIIRDINSGDIIVGTNEGRNKTGAVTKNAIAKTQQPKGQKPGESKGMVISQSDLSAPIDKGGYGLKLKEGDVQKPGSELNPATIRAAAIIQELLGENFGRITGLNDAAHTDPSSSHIKGLGIDFTTARSPDSDKDAARIVGMIQSALEEQGIKGATVLDEYFDGGKPGQYGKKSGNHFHVALKALAKGGNLGDGEMAVVGETGPEIVSGPAAVTSTSDTASLTKTMSELRSLFEEMVDIMKAQRDTSEKIYRATV
jgi:hypothetical protein